MEKSILVKTAIALPPAFIVGTGIGFTMNEGSPSEYRGPEFSASSEDNYSLSNDVAEEILEEEIEETATPSAMPSPSAIPEIVFTPTPTPTIESTPTPTPEPTPDATPEPTPTPYPYEDELPRLSTPACGKLWKILTVLKPNEEGITSDEYDAIAEEVEELHDQLVSDENYGDYDQKAMQAGRAAEVAVRNLLAKGQSEEPKTEFAVAYAVDEYCPDHEIPS